MKASTLTDRINKHLTTAKGAIAKKFQDVEKVLLGNRVHGKKYSGRGRFTSITNGTYFATIEGLKSIGVDYQAGNDAPRGGAIGDYIELTAKGKRQVAEWAKMRKAEIAEAVAKHIAEVEKKKARHIDAIKQNLVLLNANPDTVAAYFPEIPETFKTQMGLAITASKEVRGKRHGLAYKLHTMNDHDFQDALAFYWLKDQYTSVQYLDERFEDRIEINYSDIAE